MREPIPGIHNVEIVCDCKVKIEDEILAMKLTNQFHSFRQKTGKSCKLQAGLRYSPAYPDRQVGFCQYFSMLVIGLIPGVSMLYILIDNLFFRKKYLFRIRKVLRRTEAFNKWSVQ